MSQPNPCRPTGRSRYIPEGRDLAKTRKTGPVGKVQKIFEEVSTLSRKQQECIGETFSALVEQCKRGA